MSAWESKLLITENYFWTLPPRSHIDLFLFDTIKKSTASTTVFSNCLKTLTCCTHSSRLHAVQRKNNAYTYQDCMQGNGKETTTKTQPISWCIAVLKKPPHHPLPTSTAKGMDRKEITGIYCISPWKGLALRSSMLWRGNAQERNNLPNVRSQLRFALALCFSGRHSKEVWKVSTFWRPNFLMCNLLQSAIWLCE